MHNIEGERIGWVEVEYKNPLNNFMVENVKICNGCKFLKNQLIKSGKNPIYYYVCKAQDLGRLKSIDLHYSNLSGYIETGIDGEVCPFNDQIVREQKIDDILE